MPVRVPTVLRSGNVMRGRQDGTELSSVVSQHNVAITSILRASACELAGFRDARVMPMVKVTKQQS